MLYYRGAVVNPRKPKSDADRQGGRSCCGDSGGSWCANCGPPAPGPGPSCGWRVCLAGMATRKDLLGVTSIVRALGLQPALLRPAPGLLPQPGPESGQAHPRLVRPGLPGPPRHPSRQRQARAGRRRHQGRQGRTQDARGQEAPSGIRVEHQAGVHLRPLLPGGRRADPGLVQRIRLAAGLPHPRRGGVLQPRPANPAGQDDPAARFARRERTVLLRGRRLLRHRQDRSRAAGPGKPPRHPRQEQQRGLVPGDTAAADTGRSPGAGPRKYGKKIKVASLLKRRRPAPGGPQPRLWRGGGDPPVPDRRPPVAPRRHPRPLRGRATTLGAAPSC